MLITNESKGSLTGLHSSVSTPHQCHASNSQGLPDVTFPCSGRSEPWPGKWLSLWMVSQMLNPACYKHVSQGNAE